MKNVVVTGAFDDLRSRDIRFLEEAGKLGRLHVLLWSDDAVERLMGKPPKFPEEERLYLLQSIRYVDTIAIVRGTIETDSLPSVDGLHPDVWAVPETADSPAKRAFSRILGTQYLIIIEQALRRESLPIPAVPEEGIIKYCVPKIIKVLVTGCFDWFHSGHVRFFEEVSELGDLYVVVGHDENIRLLKGEGHPMFPEEERRYVVQSIRFVKQALISTGHGWLDAEPEIAVIQPDIYAVNEDGDKPEKRAFCEAHGIEYVVLKRTPKEGLPRRESTRLRGF